MLKTVTHSSQMSLNSQKFLAKQYGRLCRGGQFSPSSRMIVIKPAVCTMSDLAHVCTSPDVESPVTKSHSPPPREESFEIFKLSRGKELYNNLLHNKGTEFHVYSL